MYKFITSHKRVASAVSIALISAGIAAGCGSSAPKGMNVSEMENQIKPAMQEQLDQQHGGFTVNTITLIKKANGDATGYADITDSYGDQKRYTVNVTLGTDGRAIWELIP